jgi:hypothetical protein
MTTIDFSRGAALTPETVAAKIPLRVRLMAAEQSLPTCDVCGWPVDAAAIVPDQDRTARHPFCACAVCEVPLRDNEAGEPCCARCRAVLPERRLRVIGGRR